MYDNEYNERLKTVFIHIMIGIILSIALGDIINENGDAEWFMIGIPTAISFIRRHFGSFYFQGPLTIWLIYAVVKLALYAIVGIILLPLNL